MALARRHGVVRSMLRVEMSIRVCRAVRERLWALTWTLTWLVCLGTMDVNSRIWTQLLVRRTKWIPQGKCLDVAMHAKEDGSNWKDV